MCRQTARSVLELPVSPESPRAARDFLRQSSCPHHLPRVLESAVLLVSELVTNSVRYGGTPVVVAVDCDECSLQVRVRDGSGDLPRRRHADALAEGGRGLALLDLVSDQWGVEVDPDGKTVWFRLRAPG